MNETGLPSDFSRLRADRTVIERTLAPLIPLAEWCRNSQAALCVCEFRRPQSAAHGVQSAETMFQTELKELTHAHHIVSCDFTAGSAAAWSAEDHRRFADLLSQRLLAEISGPWTSPYFRPQANPVTPVSFETGRDATRWMNHDRALKPR